MSNSKDQSFTSLDAAWVSAAASAVCCLLSFELERRATELESVTTVSTLKDLAKLLDAASTVLPLVVGVSGRIGADTTISCALSGLQAVILNITKERHFLERHYRKEAVPNDQKESGRNDRKESEHNDRKEPGRNDRKEPERNDQKEPEPNDQNESEPNDQKESERYVLKEYWIRRSEFVSEEWKEFPWYLDDGTSRAFVVGGREASRLPLKHGGYKFKESKTCPCQAKLEEKIGVKTLGTKKTVRLLEVGTSVTVIGEAFKDSTGKIFLGSPRLGGSPFYITYGTVSELIQEYREGSRFFKFMSKACLIGWGLIITWHAIDYLRLQIPDNWYIDKEQVPVQPYSPPRWYNREVLQSYSARIRSNADYYSTRIRNKTDYYCREFFNLEYICPASGAVIGAAAAWFAFRRCF